MSGIIFADQEVKRITGKIGFMVGGEEFIEKAARVCYRSEPKGKPGDLTRKLIKAGHDAPLEFSYAMFEIKTSRAIANEIVRHRHFSFCQESTRYVNYGKRGFEFISWNGDEASGDVYRQACEEATGHYLELLDAGVKPEKARDVLPLGLATTIVVGGNYREWRHFIELRCPGSAHPDIRGIAEEVLESLWGACWPAFDDLMAEYLPERRDMAMGGLHDAGE